MKTKVLCVILLLTAPFTIAQNLEGAWESTETYDEGVEIQYVTIISDGYISQAFYDKSTGEFKGTWGGVFSVKEDVISYTFEFSSFDQELVGTSRKMDFNLIEDKLQVDDDKVWTRIDDGTPGELFGAWLISGRKRDGEIVKRDTSGPRKTMKILSGTRFQWIAFNTETKEFMGTGGGTYTTIDGKYTENIRFFSRDDSRVGASLEFNYELKDGDWHHSGLSSKGDPIYEIWSKRTQ